MLRMGKKPIIKMAFFVENVFSADKIDGANAAAGAQSVCQETLAALVWKRSDLIVEN